VLASHPDEPDAAALRALALVRAGRIEAAREALPTVPVRDAHEYLTRIVALHELGDLPRVLAQLDGPAPLPSETHARIAAAVVAARMGDAEGARARARAEIARAPTLSRHFAERAPSPGAQPLLCLLDTFETWRALHEELMRR
jgi:thioredoxin-like negative regulator of GroEL